MISSDTGNKYLNQSLWLWLITWCAGEKGVEAADWGWVRRSYSWLRTDPKSHIQTDWRAHHSHPARGMSLGRCTCSHLLSPALTWCFTFSLFTIAMVNPRIETPSAVQKQEAEFVDAASWLDPDLNFYTHTLMKLISCFYRFRYQSSWTSETTTTSCRHSRCSWRLEPHKWGCSSGVMWLDPVWSAGCLATKSVRSGPETFS